MNNFLKRIGLIQSTKIDLKTNKPDFVRLLHQNIDESDLGFGSSFLEAFSSSKNDFKGYVSSNGFKIRRKRKMFQQNMGIAVATGTFRQKGELLEIDTEINGFSNWMIFFYAFVMLFYLAFLSIFFFASESPDFFFIPIIIIHASFMLGLPYFFAKKAVSSTKRDLEKEFIYLMNKV